MRIYQEAVCGPQLLVKTKRQRPTKWPWIWGGGVEMGGGRLVNWTTQCFLFQQTT